MAWKAPRSSIVSLLSALIFVLALALAVDSNGTTTSTIVITTPPLLINKVQVYHFLVRHWVNDNGLHEGDQNCGQTLQCDWTWGEHLHRLRIEHDNYATRGTFSDVAVSPPSTTTTQSQLEMRGDAVAETDTKTAGVIVNNTVSLALYNIHSLWEKKREHYPPVCELRTNMTLAESEESRVRYGHLFDPSFKNFDGYSTTSPHAHVQRIYTEALMNATEFYPTRAYNKMIKGASYVASDCHARDGANAGRDGIVMSIRNAGFRVDGLGRCLRSKVGPEGVQLSMDKKDRYNLELKRAVISNFMFNMAFENSIEEGYVTEKPFDALMSGTVPIYLGDSAHLKKLMPYPKAVIYLSDFDHNVTSLVSYLEYLTNNETAYEEHREWRKHYSLPSIKKDNLLIGRSWQCSVCQWALDNAHHHHKRVRHCKEQVNFDGSKKVVEHRDMSIYDGKVVRGQGREVYLVVNSTLHPIPDVNTLFSLKISLKSIVKIPDSDFSSMKLSTPVPRAETEFPEVT